MDKYLKANQILWDEKTGIHVKSKFYDVEGFKTGQSSLYPVEEAEMPDVVGKTLLHLQCHFGLDTMSWARRGAFPTGVDFSVKAIDVARELNRELDLNCTFIHSDIYELPQKFHEQFDLVYTSYGVLAWLPDIRKWGEVVSHFLKPGGVFYIVEIHPFSYMLDDWKMEKAELKLRYSYFHSREPLVFETAGTYAEPDADIKANVQYEWAHSMGDIINALVDVGLSIDFLHEFDYTVFRQVEFLERKGRLFYLPEEMPKVPLLFSLKARKGV